MRRAAKWMGAALLAWAGLVGAAAAWVAWRVPLTLPWKLVDVRDWHEGRVVADGTWIVPNRDSTVPFQTSRIECVRADGRCREARASLVGRDGLSVSLETYAIVKWDDASLVFVDDAAACTRTTFTLDRRARTLVGVPEERRRSDAGPCAPSGDADAIRLSDGLSLSLRAREDALPWWGRLALMPIRLAL